MTPKHILGERTSFSKLSVEAFKDIVLENSKPLSTERYPGYQRGSKRFSDECGVPGPEFFIVGGTEATPHKYPWMASLFFTQGSSSGSYFCGGTLVCILG